VNDQSVAPMLLSMPGNPNGSMTLCFGPPQTSVKTSGVAKKPAKRSATMKSPSLLDWYRLLRAHHQWTMFQAIRYALWLTR
jgi:hypothetical protein